ncbi:DIP1984 family protein, partial [Corynebacterium amycolatum]
MLLSEALAARSEVSDRLAEINRRLALVAQVQEGDTPDEDPQALIAEAERLMARFEWLVRSINATNSATAFEDGTLSDALAKRDHLLTRRRFYTSAADQGSGRRDRYSASEIRYVATVD